MKRWIKVTTWILGSAVTVGLAILAVAPAVLSTPWGTQQLTSWLNRGMPGSLSIQQLNLSWFSGQHLAGLSLRDPEGVQILSVEQAESSASFFRLLSSCPYVCKTHIEGVQALIVQENDGNTNFQRALHNIESPSSTASKRPSSRHEELTIRLPIRGEIALNQVNIELRSPTLPQVNLENLQATVRTTSHEGPLSIDIAGLSSTAKASGSFSLKARLSGFSPSGRLVLKSTLNGYVTADPNAEIYVNLNLRQLPAATLDYLVALNFPQMPNLLTEALGNGVNLNLEQTIDSKTMSLNLQAHSPTLDAHLDARWTNGVISLSQPGQISLLITPAFVHSLDPSLVLLKPTQAKLLLERLTLSPTKNGVPSVRLKLHMDDLQLDGGPSLGVIDFTGLEGVVEHLDASESLLASLESVLKHRGSHGVLRAQGTFANKDKQLTADYIITAKQLPSLLLDQALQANGWLTDLLGEHFDGQFTHTNEARGSEMKLEFESDGLSIPALTLRQKDQILTAQPETIELQISPRFAKRLLAANQKVRIQGDSNITLSLKRLQLPMSDNFNWANARLEADLKMSPFSVSTDRGVFHLKAGKADLTGSSLSSAEFIVEGEFASDLNGPVAQAAIGKAASVRFSGALGVSKDGRKLLLKKGQLAWNSDVMAMQAVGSIDEEGRLSFLEPMTGSYHISSELLSSMGLTTTPLFSQPVALDLRVDQLNLSVRDFWNQDLLVQLKANSDLVQLSESPEEKFADLQAVTLAILLDTKQCEAGMTLFGNSVVAGKPEKTPFDLDISVNGWCSHNKWDWANLNVQARGHLNQFPVKLFAALIGQPDLVTFLGPTLDLTVDMKRDAKACSVQTPIEISLKAQGFALQAGFIASSVLSQESGKPLTVQLELTPDKFNVLKKACLALGWNGLERWKLTKNSAISIQAEQLVLPFPKPNKSFGPIKGSITAQFEPLLIQNIDSGKALAWESLKTQVASDKQEGSYLFSMQAREVPGQSSGTFSATGGLKQVWTSQGWFDVQKMNIGAKVSASHLTLAPILHVIAPDAAWSTQVPGLLGETVAVDGKLAWNPNSGRLQANIIGSQGNVAMDGSWENGFIVLHQPLVVEAKLTQKLIQEVLVDIAPILSSTIPTEQPIRFTIDSTQARIPLAGNTLQQLKIPKARLELGKVLFRSNGQIGQVSALLRGESALAKETFPVTFTPLTFSLDGGVVTIQRVDALVAERYPIAMWGSVDLGRDKVNLVIGITAQALKEAYGITIADNRYVLQLPLRGTLANASIDKVKATTRITSLVAQNHGGPNGLILGGVLDLLGGGDDQKVPPPPEPLPWADMQPTPQPEEKQQVTQSSSEEAAPQKKLSTRKKIQNQIQKGASKLFEMLK